MYRYFVSLPLLNIAIVTKILSTSPICRFQVPLIFSTAQVAIAIDVIDSAGQVITAGVAKPGKVVIVHNIYTRMWS